MLNILRRLWPRRKPLDRTATKDPGSFLRIVNETNQVMSEASEQILTAVESRRRLASLPKPIPLAEREPGPGDKHAIDSCCWWGDWYEGHWFWVWESRPPRDEAYWLPASVEILPARCCPPGGG